MYCLISSAADQLLHALHRVRDDNEMHLIAARVER